MKTIIPARKLFSLFVMAEQPCISESHINLLTTARLTTRDLPATIFNNVTNNSYYRVIWSTILTTSVGITPTESKTRTIVHIINYTKQTNIISVQHIYFNLISTSLHKWTFSCSMFSPGGHKRYPSSVRVGRPSPSAPPNKGIHSTTRRRLIPAREWQGGLAIIRHD